jgi:ubiquitin-like 1-activating enzyme E1 B
VKNIVLTGFGKITILDLDTIDLSNLNRQFLFKKKDVKQSKALVRSYTLISTSLSLMTGSQQIAAQTAGPFNPNVQLIPVHGNIKEPQYDIPWFQTFDIVLNALDNLGELQPFYLSPPVRLSRYPKMPADM